MRRHAPATERNRQPLLEVLTRVAPPGASVLEVASGSGQHARFFAEHLDLLWHPTDRDPEALASIDAWADGHPQVAPAQALDVLGAWPEVPFDMVVACNLVHITPWAVTGALVAGAARVLSDRGQLILYGPFKRKGAHTAPSNATFEKWLWSLSEDYGVRDLEEVEALATAEGLRLEEIVEMPANNLTVIFRAP